MVKQFEKHDGNIISYIDDIHDEEFKKFIYDNERKNDARILRDEKKLKAYILTLFKELRTKIINRLSQMYVSLSVDGELLSQHLLQTADNRDVIEYNNRVKNLRNDLKPLVNEYLLLSLSTQEEIMYNNIELDVIETFVKIEEKGEAHIREQVEEEEIRQSKILNSERQSHESEIAAALLLFKQRLWMTHFKKVTSEIKEISLYSETLAKFNQKLKSIKERINIANRNIFRLITNEERRISQQITKSIFKDNKVEQYVYITEADRSVCEQCGELHGKIFNRIDAEPGLNYPKMHLNCRCTTFAYNGNKLFDRDNFMWR
uniref:minor capsid protein n=1 Tax=Aerococcus urinaeequi TaxID=51665 RepID=UPI00352A815E